MNLIESARKWVIANLPYDDTDAEIVQALNDKDAHDLLVTYHNWISRLVQPIPRMIEKSSAFASNPHRETFADALAAIERDVRAGNDLTKYLSTGVRVALKLPGRGRGASDLDMLLNDWGVHHLHLSKELRADGFVQRTGPLLFVRFTLDTAYFLDIADHTEWTKESIANALVNEFPNAGGVYEIKGVCGVSQERSDEEHKKLRNAGVNTVRMIGGKAVTGGGYNVQGRSTMAIREADQLISVLQGFEKAWNENEEAFRADLKQQGVELPHNPTFEFAIDQRGPIVVEANSRTALRLFG